MLFTYMTNNMLYLVKVKYLGILRIVTFFTGISSAGWMVNKFFTCNIKVYGDTLYIYNEQFMTPCLVFSRMSNHGFGFASCIFLIADLQCKNKW